MQNWQLRELCVQRNWFTSGTNSQYDKLFQMNESGKYSIRDIALVIWLCTPNIETIDIEMALANAGM